jgi:hypothetical protein
MTHVFVEALDLNDHREFSPKQAQTFDYDVHRIKVLCTDHGNPLQRTEPQLSNALKP